MRKPSSETDSKVFATRLRKIMDENGENQTDLAEKIGVTRQSIAYYRSGQSLPDVEKLKKIAEHYGVSSDWLIGLQEERTVNLDIQQACKTTGLSEGAVNVLCSLKNISYITILSSIIEHDAEVFRVLYDICEGRKSFWQWIEIVKKKEQATPEEQAAHFDDCQKMCKKISMLPIPLSDAPDFYLESAKRIFGDIITEIIKKDRPSAANTEADK